ncbi:MAG TPA: type II toxin-antitoxin system VapC family toxin, partial [Candidatus Acidoferrales bacterium]|nr:type II toxin-antitoxin system VapC family toxin [Candidatus Acidoferrales bacterium]
MYLIDTNVISEVRKGSRCNPRVAAWYKAIEDDQLYLSVIVLGEIRQGIERVRRRDPHQAAAIEKWLAGVIDAFGARILPVDSAVADAWGRLSA